jgi:Asp/Glu/hydantoin racemase
MAASGPSRPRLLVINPNTTESMTLALQPAIDALHLPVDVSYFTCPTPGISSINSPADSAESAKLCLPHLLPLLPHYDAFLVACYSHHPLVSQLKAECTALATEAISGDGGMSARRYVTGIFEASVLASLSLLSENESFGIVSTGKVWEDALTEAVHALLGGNSVSRYSGTETTGLNATELHDLPASQVQTKMKEATKRLLKHGKVNAICLGCAGMVGLDQAVREACIDQLGQDVGRKVHIIDGVKAGVAQLVGNSRTAF